jgi:excisionase family DNA binding protein
MEQEMEGYDERDKMLTPREVAELLHVHTNTLRRWSDKGIVVAYRISPRGDRRYRLHDIDRFLARSNSTPDNSNGD